MVIARAVRPRRLASAREIEARLLEGLARNPTLPGWRLYRARLLHQAGLMAEARKILDGLPPALQQLHPFRRMAAELRFDNREWDAAIEWATPIATQDGMRELISAARKGAEMEAAEKDAIAADQKKSNPRLRVKTSRGEFEIELFEDDAPRAVRNFMDLAMTQKFYDGLRVHDAFGANYVTIGDPRSRGDGPPDPDAPDGPGWRLKADSPKRPLLPGYLATAYRGQGIYHGSQFAIALSPLLAEGLKVAVFGRVTRGMEVVRDLEFEDRIERIEVISKRDHDYDAVACRLRN
jgi:cyclophilin family peptidyl-prolyl cis-trans isomerase